MIDMKTMEKQMQDLSGLLNIIKPAKEFFLINGEENYLVKFRAKSAALRDKLLIILKNKPKNISEWVDEQVVRLKMSNNATIGDLIKKMKSVQKPYTDDEILRFKDETFKPDFDIKANDKFIYDCFKEIIDMKQVPLTLKQKMQTPEFWHEQDLEGMGNIVNSFCLVLSIRTKIS